MTALSPILFLVSLTLGTSGHIAFVSGTEQEDQCVCVLDTESGAVMRVGPGQLDTSPTWSPDGSWLAFETKSADGIAICIARPDGSERRIVSKMLSWNRYPRWSADGTQLAYAGNPIERFTPRVVTCIIASGHERLWGEEAPSLTRPVWMPSMKILNALRPEQQLDLGDKGAEAEAIDELLRSEQTIVAIAFSRAGEAFALDPCFVTPQKTMILPEWVMPSPGQYAEWSIEPSPDGDMLAYETNDGGDREIFVLSRLGAQNITNHRAADWNPVWSPDGEWVAFESFRDGRRGIYRSFADTGRVVPVAVTEGSDNWSPSWSPDGKEIAFVSNRTGDREIFVTSLDGEDARQLTNRPGPDFSPAWRPQEKK